MKPNSDLAIWNYLAREIVARGAVDQEFVKEHCVFAAGPADIGYGMRDTTPSPSRRRRTLSCASGWRC